jgi:hypothetical protein
MQGRCAGKYKRRGIGMGSRSPTHSKVVNVAFTLRAPARVAASVSPISFHSRLKPAANTPVDIKQNEYAEMVSWCGPWVKEARIVCKQMIHRRICDGTKWPTNTKVVNVVFTLRALARLVAAASPILFRVRLNGSPNTTRELKAKRVYGDV